MAATAPTAPLATPAPSPTDARPSTAGRGDVRSALVVGSIAACVKLATALPVLTRYGWNRDELYFLQAGRHLALGYVDFPPVTALVARLVVTLVGPSLFALRLTGVVAAMGVVMLIALSVAELGGGRRAQVLATGAFVASPWGLALGMLLHPTMFDALAWAAFAYVALRILRRPEPGLWPLLGLVAGLGLESKWTIIVEIASFLAGTALLCPQRLRDRRALVALGIALALTAPELAWEIGHGWPTLAFLPSQNAATSSATPTQIYLLEQVLFLAASLALTVTGVRALWRDGLGPLALLAPLACLCFAIERGRSYYALPAIVPALAAGAVTLERWWPLATRRARRGCIAGLAVLQLAGLGLGAILVWPVLPTRTMVSLGVWRQSFFADEIGWPALVADTARAWRELPADRRAQTVILAANYGEAGALDLWGPRAGLPTALSGHLSFQYWRPRRLPQRWLLTVGYGRGRLRRLCATFQIAGHVSNRWHIDNEEYGLPIAECHLRAPLGRVWWRAIATDEL